MQELSFQKLSHDIKVDIFWEGHKTMTVDLTVSK